MFNQSTTINGIFLWEVSDSARIIDLAENKLNKKYSNWNIVDPKQILKRSDLRILFFGAEKDLLLDIFFDILVPGTYYPRECKDEKDTHT